jgi:hypothetical protein
MNNKKKKRKSSYFIADGDLQISCNHSQNSSDTFQRVGKKINLKIHMEPEDSPCS